MEKSYSPWNIVKVSSEALGSSWSDGSLHGDLAAKKGSDMLSCMWMVLVL